MSALLRLAFWQLKNTLRDAFTNPRKLIPLSLVALVFGWSGYVALTAPPGTFAPKNTVDLLEAHRGELHDAAFAFLALIAASILDRGLAGGSLIYSPGDRDYLFPMPFPRRLVLAFKLLSPMPGILLTVLYAAVRPSASLPGVTLPPWALSLAFFACAGGYQNLAVAGEMAYGLGQSPLLRRGLLAVLALLLAYGGFLARRHGVATLLGDAAHGPLMAVFYPCRLVADVFLPSVPGAHGWPALGQLLLFYGLSLAVVFLRSPDFYEAAAVTSERVTRAQRAQAEGHWFALLTSKKRAHRPYSLSPWGRGVGAVVWAHLAAAAKNPFVSFGLPSVLGAALGLAALRSDPESAVLMVGIFAFYYLAGTTIGGGLFYFRRSLLRQPLIRPLPLPADWVVLAEILPRVLLAAPFYGVCGLFLLVGHGPPGAGPALLCLPLVSLTLSLLQYSIALSYPSLEDKLQAAIAQGFQFVLALLLTVVLALFFAVPLGAGASVPTSLILFVAGCLATTLLLWHVTVRAYRAYPPSENRMTSKTALKRVLKPALITLLLLGLALGVGRSISKSLHKPPPPPRTVATRVGDIVIQVGETGTIEPVDKVDVKSKAAGRLLSIPIQEGQYVRQGQLIALVDRSQIDPQLARDQAQLQQAQARLAQTEAEYALQVRQTQAAIAQAQAGLGQAQAHLAAVEAGARPQELAQGREAVARAKIAADDALRTQKRRADLLGKGFISQADFDASQVAVDTAQSTLATARQQLALTQAGPRVQDVNDARSQVETARVQLEGARANSGQDAVKRSDIAQARASVAQISGDIQQLEVNVADTRIIAPASGLVLKKYKEPNEIVQSATTGFSDAQSIVATLGSRLEVKVGINEVDIAKVHAHALATITVDALPDASFAGYVTEIAPASTNAFSDSGGSSGGTNSISKFSVKVAFDRYDPRLRSGMSANVSVISQKHSRVILAPLEAVPFAGARGQVTVLAAGGRQDKRTVVTGLRNDTDVEIVSGLRAGETLVVPPISGAGRRKTDINGNGN